jgi:hypothetical protein
MRAAYAPPGWPDHVRPPGAPDWEESAVAFLFDCCPADFRAYPVLRRHPVVLARFAATFVAGQERSAAEGLAGIRTSVQGRVGAEVVESAASAWSRTPSADRSSPLGCDGSAYGRDPAHTPDRPWAPGWRGRTT